MVDVNERRGIEWHNGPESEKKILTLLNQVDKFNAPDAFVLGLFSGSTSTSLHQSAFVQAYSTWRNDHVIQDDSVMEILQ